MTGRHLALLTLLTVAACLPAWSPADEPAKAEKPAADSMVGKEAGDVRDDNGLKMKLVWCPAGFVTMERVDVVDRDGVPKEISPVKVFLSRGYWLGRCEVTRAEWKAMMSSEPWKEYRSEKEGDTFPVMNVSWEEAMSFCRKLTDEERGEGRLPAGWEYTLPSEAEWERACRARTETTFSFGDDESQLDEYAWFRGNNMKAGEMHTHPVGQKKANPWGLHDMHGNVWEWCRDVGSDMLPGGRDPEVKPGETIKGTHRVMRGGSLNDVAVNCRSAKRGWYVASGRGGNVGFRVALSPVQPAVVTSETPR